MRNPISVYDINDLDNYDESAFNFDEPFGVAPLPGFSESEEDFFPTEGSFHLRIRKFGIACRIYIPYFYFDQYVASINSGELLSP